MGRICLILSSVLLAGCLSIPPVTLKNKEGHTVHCEGGIYSFLTADFYTDQQRACINDFQGQGYERVAE